MAEQIVLDQPEENEGEPQLKLTMRAQTPQEEFSYILFLLGRMPWYEERGYEIVLLGDTEFNNRLKTADENERVHLFDYFAQNLYEAEFYQPALTALEAVRPNIEATFPALVKWHQAWGFSLVPHYQLLVTRYGPGGSYDVSGLIKMMTLGNGKFRRPHPGHTAVHEIIHIGVEETIVQRFGLSHEEKEALVDTLCLLLTVPIYRLDVPHGKREVLELFAKIITAEALEDLPAVIAQYAAQRV